MSIGGTITSATQGSILFAGASGVLAQNNTEFYWDNSNTRLGLRTTTPSSDLSFGGNQARTLGVERHTGGNQAGHNLTINSGGAASGATDKNAGNLVLKTGVSTGSGSGYISFETAAAGAAGTTDRTPSERMRITGDGGVGIGTTSVNGSALLHLSSTTRGFLPPSMTAAQRDAISTPSSGLTVYNSETNKIQYYNGTSWGAHNYISTTATLASGSWSLSGGLYQQAISNANITANSFVVVIPDNSSFSVITTAQLLQANTSGSGTVTVFAKNQPTSNIGVTLQIFNN